VRDVSEEESLLQWERQGSPWYHTVLPMALESPDRRKAASDRVRLVLVEDDRDTREMYCAWLEHVGFEVFDAEDADTGFLHALHYQPRVVVTDHLLRSGPTGAHLCERLKEDPRTEHIRTLLMTGSAERQTVEGALKSGCAVVRLKPYLPDAMLADIEAMVRGQQIEAFPHEHDQQ